VQRRKLNFGLCIGDFGLTGYSVFACHFEHTSKDLLYDFGWLFTLEQRNRLPLNHCHNRWGTFDAKCLPHSLFDLRIDSSEYEPTIQVLNRCT
jgi:hypothetical protein